jgi:hypothetical protein
MNERVQHHLPTGLVEIDGQLVAVDAGDRVGAELDAEIPGLSCRWLEAREPTGLTCRQTFAAQLLAAALVAPTIAMLHVLVIGAAAIRLMRLAEQAAGAGALRTFAFVVHGDLSAVTYHRRTGWS